MDYGLRSIQNWDWATLLIVVSFILLAVTRHLFPRRFLEFLQLPITDKYFKLQGKGYEINHPFNMLFFVIQVISISLFLYLLVFISQPKVTEENNWLYLQLLTGLSLFILAKYFLEKLFSNILAMETLVNSYLYEKLSYTGIISLLILVGNVVFYFAIKPSGVTIWIFTLVIVGLHLMSLISSFKRNWNVILRHFSYFILYLCALEIAPYIILYHMVNL